MIDDIHNIKILPRAKSYYKKNIIYNYCMM